MVGTLKPSIEILLLHSLPFAPFDPLCSLRSPSLPLLPFTPFTPCLLPSLPVCYISTICDHRSFFHHRWWGPYEALLWLCEWNLGEQRGKRAKVEQTGSLNRVFFTDSRPFSRIWGLFRDSGPFSGIRDIFRGFAAFSWIRGLFADSRIHSQGSEGSERATWRNFRYLIFIHR